MGYKDKFAVLALPTGLIMSFIGVFQNGIFLLLGLNP